MENQDNLLKQLKSLKLIRPELDFAIQSRKAILSSRKKSYYQILFTKELRQVGVWTLAMGMAAALLFSISSLSRLRLNGLPNQLITSLNGQDLVLEKENLKLNIDLAELKYYKDSTNQVTFALDAILGNNHSLESASIRKQTEVIDRLIKEL